MLRVTNYFETQVRVPVSEDLPSDRTLKTTVNGGKPSSHTHVHSSTNRKMTGEQMLRWYSKILDNVRLRYRKLQRFAR
jgi:mitogen-activated protein kinase kinase kinase